MVLGKGGSGVSRRRQRAIVLEISGGTRASDPTSRPHRSTEQTEHTHFKRTTRNQNSGTCATASWRLAYTGRFSCEYLRVTCSFDLWPLDLLLIVVSVCSVASGVGGLGPAQRHMDMDAPCSTSARAPHRYVRTCSTSSAILSSSSASSPCRDR